MFSLELTRYSSAVINNIRYDTTITHNYCYGCNIRLHIYSYRNEDRNECEQASYDLVRDTNET